MTTSILDRLNVEEAVCIVCEQTFMYVRSTKPRNRCDEHRGARVPKPRDPARIPHQGRGDAPAHWERKRPRSGPIRSDGRQVVDRPEGAPGTPETSRRYSGRLEGLEEFTGPMGYSSGWQVTVASPGMVWPSGGFTFDDFVPPDRFPTRHFAGEDQLRANRWWKQHGRKVFHGGAGTDSCGIKTIGSWLPRPMCCREYGRSLVAFVREWR